MSPLRVSPALQGPLGAGRGQRRMDAAGGAAAGDGIRDGPHPERGVGTRVVGDQQDLGEPAVGTKPGEDLERLVALQAHIDECQRLALVMHNSHLAGGLVMVALLAAACTGTEQQPVDEGLRKDLELAFTASPITLASSAALSVARISPVCT